MQIVVHSLMVGNLRVGYRLDIGNDVCDVSSSIFESFYSNISKKEAFCKGEDIPMSKKGNTYVSEGTDDVYEVKSSKDIEELCRNYRISLYTYKAIDYFTDETILESDSKVEIAKAIKQWLLDNPGSNIVIYEDDKCIYP